MVRGLLVGAIALSVLWAVHAAGQPRSFTLAADERLDETGLLDFIVPRFALKHGIRPEVQVLPPERVAGADVDAALGEGSFLAEDGRSVVPVFRAAGASETRYALRLSPGGPGAEHARTFAEWLTGEIGRRTVQSHEADGSSLYVAGAGRVETAQPEVVPGDPEEGARLAVQHCGRCHVVNEENRFAGIGSTPSFGALRALPDWETKFQAFWSANPHPSFTYVDGVTDPPDPNQPPHVAPVQLTLENLEAIFAFAAALEPKDLGPPIEAR